VAITFNPQALFKKIINPHLVPKEIEEPPKAGLHQEQAPLSSDNEMPPIPTQPPIDAPNEIIIGNISRSYTLSASIETTEDHQEPSFPWKTDCVPHPACLLPLEPPTMIKIIMNIQANPKKLFMALHA
jgi:hypothetical protein